MSHTDTQQVCRNGHQITTSINTHPENGRKFCPTCGEPTITECPYCKAPIPGHQYYDGVISLHKTPVPLNCVGCGKPFPWNEKKTATVQTIAAETKPLVQVETLCSRFHLVAKQLRERHEGRPTLDIADEYDVQDLLHTLLRLHFDDIRPEEWTPSYAGKASRMDFLLKKHDIVIECKKTRVGLGAKALGTELIEDIARYRSHPECKTLVCFVYDPDGRIANPRGIENDLTRKEEAMDVRVFIVPKGY